MTFFPFLLSFVISAESRPTFGGPTGLRRYGVAGRLGLDRNCPRQLGPHARKELRTILLFWDHICAVG